MTTLVATLVREAVPRTRAGYATACRTCRRAKCGEAGKQGRKLRRGCRHIPVVGVRSRASPACRLRCRASARAAARGWVAAAGWRAGPPLTAAAEHGARGRRALPPRGPRPLPPRATATRCPRYARLRGRAGPGRAALAGTRRTLRGPRACRRPGWIRASGPRRAGCAGRGRRRRRRAMWGLPGREDDRASGVTCHPPLRTAPHTPRAPHQRAPHQQWRAAPAPPGVGPHRCRTTSCRDPLPPPPQQSRAPVVVRRSGGAGGDGGRHAGGCDGGRWRRATRGLLPESRFLRAAGRMLPA